MTVDNISLNMNKADPYRPALLSLGDVYAVDFGFGIKQESFGFIAVHKGGIEDVIFLLSAVFTNTGLFSGTVSEINIAIPPQLSTFFL